MTPRPYPTRLLVAAMALIAGGLLTACVDGGPPGGASQPFDFASGTRDPIRISRTQLAHDIAFAPGSSPTSTVASGGEMAKLYTFLEANQAGPSDALLVQYAATPPELARARAIAAALDGAGLHATVAETANLGPTVVRVVIERYVALAPDCPNWSAAPSPGFDNLTPRNFGCADQTNLAAMVVNPRDLAEGQDMGPARGDAVTRPVALYNLGVRVGASGGGGGAPGAGGGASGSMGGGMSGGQAGGGLGGPSAGGGGP